MRYYTWIMLLSLFTSCTHHQAVESNQRGMDYITREQPRKALEEFNHAISLDSDFLSAYYNRAIVRANLKQNEEALKDMNYVIANVPNHALAYYNRGIIYENLGGIVRYGMKDLDGALADYNKAISLGLKSSAVYFNRGVIFHQKGQLSDAIESYSRSIEIDPSNARAYYNRAISKLVIDNYKEALQDLEISKRLGYSKAAEIISQYY